MPWSHTNVPGTVVVQAVCSLCRSLGSYETGKPRFPFVTVSQDTLGARMEATHPRSHQPANHPCHCLSTLMSFSSPSAWPPCPLALPSSCQGCSHLGALSWRPRSKCPFPHRNLLRYPMVASTFVLPERLDAHTGLRSRPHH